jgi:1-acyl-sn-glycerol-3-phosphate acyltransferase
VPYYKQVSVFIEKLLKIPFQHPTGTLDHQKQVVQAPSDPREQMASLIRSIFFYCALVLSTLFMGSTSIICYHLTGDTDKANRYARLWGRINIWAAGVRVRVDGLENLNPNETYILAANHQSWFDVFAAVGKLPIQIRMLTKQELFRIPVLGPAMLASGYIPVDRSDRRKAFDSMNTAAERIRTGASVFVFPEGTRSADGVLQEFKSGAFTLAMKAGKPVVPVSISGSHRIIAKRGSWDIHPGVVHITIGTPIPTAEMSSRDRNLLMTNVREAIKRHLTQAEGGYLHNRPFYRGTHTQTVKES